MIQKVTNLNISPEYNYFICGNVGRGKSTLAKLIIEIIANFETHAIIITDINDEYSGDYLIYTFGDFLEYYHDLEHFKPGKIYVLKFSQNLTDYEKVISLIHAEFNNIYLILEESNILTSPNYIQYDFQQLVALHRHSDIGYLCITRRPAEISRFLTAQTHVYFSFQISEPIDLDYLKKKGFNPDELPNLERPVYKNNKLIDLDFAVVDKR